MGPKKQTNSIYDQYFTITQEYIDKYGPNTILFYQVGAFFEMYGVQHPVSGDITKSKVEDFTQCAQLNMSSKEIEAYDGTVLMAGFRDYSLEKYLKISTINGYTAVVYTQNMTNPKAITRDFYGVYSPGTYISYDTDCSQQLSNNIMCIWLSTYSQFNTKEIQLVCGISSAHIFTGESTIFEYETKFIMNPTTFDELERYVSVIAPSEAIVISFLSEKDTNMVLQYSGLRTLTIHKVVMETEINLRKIEIVENCQKQRYITHILSSIFGEEAYSICKEFNTHMIATQSFCYLTNFLQEHNPDLIKKVSIPFFNNSTNRMILANHTLKQLNIIDDDTIDGKKSGRFSSVLAFLNKCCNPMGKRIFQKQLTNPVFDVDWLNKEYDMTSHFLQYDSDVLISIRKGLHKIKDLEKICRQIVVKKVYPSSIYYLYSSIQQIQDINQMSIFENNEISQYLCNHDSTFIHETCQSVLNYMNSVLIIDRCKGLENVSVFSENIIRSGICENLDQLTVDYQRNLMVFDKVRVTFNDMMRKADNKGEDMDYVKVHETDKSGSSLQLTKKRGELLRQVLKGITVSSIEFTPDFIIPIKDIRITKASSSNEEIDFPQLSAVIRKILILKDKISEEISKAFLNFLRTLEKDWYNKIECLIQWTIRLDVLQSKTYIAKEYNYCRPSIDDSLHQSFFNAKGMRHVLIEHIQQNELYVTNDLALSHTDDSYNGLLIFGTNAVGKTSLIRAIGICIIMAQSGLYVPCSQFIYKPYTAIFSRILGNDNIFKGLSTFAVEMSELRIILKMSDKNSLVLGDELCSGTEIESALSIFSAGLVELHEKHATYLFATHFHEITKYEEITSLNKLGLKHMTVHYDHTTASLVYDRLLKDGQGARMYGLEVCKSLYMEPAFLENAYAFRNKYFPDQQGELGFKTTTYNAKKVRGYCEMCHGELAAEIHHLTPQKLSNEDGFVNGFHKNHVANLAALCEKCHNKIHTEEGLTPMKKKKTTKGYILSK